MSDGAPFGDNNYVLIIMLNEEQHMEPMDLIRDKFSQDCTIETVLHLLMSHFDMSEEEAQAEIDTYFRIVDMIDEDRKKAERVGK